MNKETLIKLKLDLNNFNSSSKIITEYVKLIGSFGHILSNFGFSLSIWNSLRYMRKYLSDVKFDNFFITTYFRHIDARRFFDGRKKTLLPFKRFERESMYYPLQIYISSYQKPTMKLNLTVNSILVIALISSIVLDYLVFDFLCKVPFDIFF